MGDVNFFVLIVIILFMMIYVVIDYVYFVFVMFYDRRYEKEFKYGLMNKKMNFFSGEMGNGCLGYGICFI